MYVRPHNHDGGSHQGSSVNGDGRSSKTTFQYGDISHTDRNLRYYLTMIMKRQKLYGKLDTELIRLILRDGPQAESQNMSLIIKTLWNEIGIQLAEREVTAQYIRSSSAAKRAYAERLAWFLLLRTRFIGLLSARDQYVRRIRSMVNSGGILRRSFITSFDEIRLITLALIEICLKIYICTGKRHEPYKLGFDAPRGQDILGAILAEELFNPDIMTYISEKYIDRPDLIEKFVITATDRSAIPDDNTMNKTLNLSDLSPPPRTMASPSQNPRDKLVDSYHIHDIYELDLSSHDSRAEKTVAMLLNVSATLTQLLELPCTVESLASLMFLTGARPANIQSHVGSDLIQVFGNLMPGALVDPARYIEASPDQTIDALLEYFSGHKRLTRYLMPYPHTSEFVRRRAASLDQYFVFSLLIFDKFRHNAEAECQRRMSDAHAAISPLDKYPRSRSSSRQHKSVYSRAISAHKKENSLQVQNMLNNELFYSQNHDVHSTQSSFISPSINAQQQPKRAASSCKPRTKQAAKSSHRSRAPLRTQDTESRSVSTRVSKQYTPQLGTQNKPRSTTRSASTAKKPARSGSTQSGKAGKRKLLEARRPSAVIAGEYVGTSNAYVVHPPPKYYPMSTSRSGSPSLKGESPTTKNLKLDEISPTRKSVQHMSLEEDQHADASNKEVQDHNTNDTPDAHCIDKTPGLTNSLVSDHIFPDCAQTPSEECAQQTPAVGSVVHNAEPFHNGEDLQDHLDVEPQKLAVTDFQPAKEYEANTVDYVASSIQESADGADSLQVHNLEICPDNLQDLAPQDLMEADAPEETYEVPAAFESTDEQPLELQCDAKASSEQEYDLNDFAQEAPGSLDIAVESEENVFDEIGEPAEEAIVEDGRLRHTEMNVNVVIDGRPVSRGIGRSVTRAQPVRNQDQTVSPPAKTDKEEEQYQDDFSDGNDDAPGVSLGLNDTGADFDDFEAF